MRAQAVFFAAQPEHHLSGKKKGGDPGAQVTALPDSRWRRFIRAARGAVVC